MATKKKITKKKTVKKKPTPKLSPEEKRRAEWEINNELISTAFFTAILTNKKFPTYEALAKQLNLSVKTVQRHLKDEEMFEDLKTKMKALKNKALITLAVRAIEGKNHQMMRLFFEVTDDVKQKDSNITIYINGKQTGANV